ncbi:SH3 domain-containing protein [Kaistia algarum]|uniref:SH3 domain-containing protein n=1 Tax=Kaistia algarum TaxID=2083279 RepID=UPI001403EA0E|nr:SH3 domain-containing protein [Kaistia algarum]MCX5515650.1 SH3 domain-containing protein [Kaistia algarum]
MSSIGPVNRAAGRLWRRFRAGGLRTLALCAGLVLAPSLALAVNGFTTGNVNMRTGPGTGFDKITTLPAGIGVEVLGCTNNGWCQVSAGGPPGWISGSYLERMSGPRPVYEGPPIVVQPPVVVEPPYYGPDYYEPGYPPPPPYYRPGYRPPPPRYYDEPGYRPPPPGYGAPGYRPPPPGYGNQPGYRPPPPPGNQPGYRPPPPGNQPGYRPPPPGNQPGNRPPPPGNPPPYQPPQPQPQQPQQPGLIKPGVQKVQPGKGQMFPCQPDALIQCQQ